MLKISNFLLKYISWWGILYNVGILESAELGDAMKNLSLLTWLSQLALSVAVPPIGFVWLGVWLKSRFSWGIWVVIVCVVLGLVFALDGLRYSLKLMERLAKNETEPETRISFNEHD